MAGKTDPRKHVLRASKGIGLIALLLIIGLTAAQAQTLPQRVVGTPALLLANPGFDAGNGAGMPIGWAVTGPQGSAAVINRQADRTAGQASLQVTDVAGSSVAVRSEKAVATPGRSYTLTIKEKAGSGTPAALYLEFWDFNGARVGVVQTQPEASAQWQTVTLEADAPATAAHVTALIYGTQAAAGVSYWDEAELIMEPAAYRPGAGLGPRVVPRRLPDRVGPRRRPGRPSGDHHGRSGDQGRPAVGGQRVHLRLGVSRSARSIGCGTPATTISRRTTTSATPRVGRHGAVDQAARPRLDRLRRHPGVQDQHRRRELAARSPTTRRRRPIVAT